jgi:hypothetical protein
MRKANNEESRICDLDTLGILQRLQTGNGYNDLSVAERFGYAEGLVYGLLVSSVLTGSDSNLEILNGCL